MALRPVPHPAVITNAEQLPASIQGHPAGSLEEARVAVALGRLKYEYLYQYSYMGGNTVAGGQVVDFMVLTVPKLTPIYVQGEFWHNARTNAADVLKQQEIANDGRFAQPVLLWGADLTTIEDAQAILQRELI